MSAATPVPQTEKSEPKIAALVSEVERLVAHLRHGLDNLQIAHTRLITPPPLSEVPSPKEELQSKPQALDGRLSKLAHDLELQLKRLWELVAAFDQAI